MSIYLFKYKMSRSALHRCHLSFIRPLLEYGDVIFDNCSQNDKNTLENIQYNALRLITGCKKGTSRQLLLEEARLCTLQTRRTFHKILKFHSIVFKTCPDNLHTFLTRPLGNSVIPFSLQVHIYGTCYRPAYVAVLKKLYLNAN